MIRASTVRLTLIAVTAAASLAAGAAQAGGRPRVFIPESESWSVGGGFGWQDLVGFGDFSGGAKPQTAEIIKTVQDRCPELIVTRDPDRADYVVLLQHEGGKIFVRKDNKYVVFNALGDALGSGSTRSLGNAIKDACVIIRADRRAVEAATAAAGGELVTDDGEG